MGPQTRNTVRSPRAKRYLVADGASSSSTLGKAVTKDPQTPKSEALTDSDDPSGNQSRSVALASLPAPSRPSKRPFEATSNTPFKPTSSRTGGGKSRSMKANKSGASRPTHSHSHASEPATPRATKQLTMDALIKEEMRDAILYDPKFIEHFLSGNSSRLDPIVERCRSNNAYDSEEDQWLLPSKIPSEHVIYAPLRDILNTIKNAVDNAPSTTGDHEAHPEDHTDQWGDFDTNTSAGTNSDSDSAPDSDPDDISSSTQFLNTSNNPIPSDEADTADLKPDLSLFENVTCRHWESLRFPVEVKKVSSHHKYGIKQLSRYARAVFAHQLHRRHLYGMMVCGTEATFVRFDRAGILYSPRIDICKQSDAFTRVFASLLMLDRADEGYDTSFTTKLNFDGRLEYYIDLPESAFKDTTVTRTSSSKEPEPSGACPKKRRFLVVEKLCHRKSIRGRATIVLRIREIPNETRSAGSKRKRKADTLDDPSDPNLKEYVLKLIWRDPDRGSEGEVLEQVTGIYGLAQHVWHCDAPGKCRCSPTVEDCATCVDETVQIAGLKVCENLRDISVYEPPEDEDETQAALLCVDTTEFHSVSHGRKRRIYSYILMSSIGIPLPAAETPHQFMTAVLDAILGYWRLVNLGILHRDISDGNVMMFDENQDFQRREWTEDKSEELKATDPILAESEEKLQEILVKLNRNPVGMLSDFDLHAKHSSISLPAVPVGPLDATADILTQPSKASDHGSSPGGSHSPGIPTQDNSLVEMPRLKRRRTNSGSSVAISFTTPSTVTRSLTMSTERSAQVREDRKGPIDFRTGTPAFMSLRVLEVDPGTPYYHNFLDDLESFFWLIFWSAAAHLDPGARHPTRKAQEALDSIDQCALSLLADWKRAKLRQCSKKSGASIKLLLQSFNNSWASHPLFVNTIVRLGNFFETFDYDELSETSPVNIFLNIVDVIIEELDHDRT